LASPLAADFFHEPSRENVYVNAAISGMSKRETEEKFDSIVEFADIGNFIDTAVKHYSSGMFVRLGFAVAVHCEPDILLVDEVLAVGDEGFQHKCFNKIAELKKKGTTVVLVSHNMHLVQTFADRALLVNDGTAHDFESVAGAVHAYSNLFISDKGQGLEKIASGNGEIQFYDVCINKRIFRPLETLYLILKYVSSKEFQDVEVDLGIFSSTQPTQYFQATNHAWNETINLRQGRHELLISIEDIPLNNAVTTVEVAVFSGKRRRGGELLFWWSIPVEFRGAEYSTGRNFLKSHLLDRLVEFQSKQLSDKYIMKYSFGNFSTSVLGCAHFRIYYQYSSCEEPVPPQQFLLRG
jgi:energy-coupling factor transporter ATP-binding protein EcfA2